MKVDVRENEYSGYSIHLRSESASDAFQLGRLKAQMDAMEPKPMHEIEALSHSDVALFFFLRDQQKREVIPND